MVEEGKPLVTEEDVEWLKSGEIDFQDLVSRGGIVEYIDAEEEEDLFIAMNEFEITPPDHTHLEIDPALILGIGAAHVPFPEHNASPRVTMGAGMIKQALGFGCSNMKLRPDTRGHLLHYAQKPLVHTQTSEIIGSDDRPAGQNLVVAIQSYEGFNIEDALIFNQASIDRGGVGRSHFFRTYDAKNAVTPPADRSIKLKSRTRKWQAHTVRNTTRTSTPTASSTPPRRSCMKRTSLLVRHHRPPGSLKNRPVN